MNRPLLPYPVVLGLKNEVGTGDSDPCTEAALAYQRYWAQGGELCKRASVEIVLDRTQFPAKQGRSKLSEVSYCPAFLFAIAGPWLCIAGAILAGEPVVQRRWDFIGSERGLKASLGCLGFRKSSTH